MAVISSRPVFSPFMCISLRIVASDLMSRQISRDLCSSGGFVRIMDRNQSGETKSDNVSAM